MLSLTPDNSLVVLIDWQERLASVMPDAVHADHLRKACILIEGARAVGVPVVVTEQYPRGLGHTVPALREALGESAAPVEKRDFACTEVPEFAELLERSGRSHVILAGMESHICVFQTARGLASEGYVVHVARDAVVSRSKRDYLAALSLYEHLGAVTTSVETVLFDWVRRAEGATFKAISRLVR
jgi:nicotinamidase-related amidase